MLVKSCTFKQALWYETMRQAPCIQHVYRFTLCMGLPVLPLIATSRLQVCRWTGVAFIMVGELIRKAAMVGTRW